MNAKSAVESESRPTLSLHKLQVYRWFRKNGGKEISAKEKPLLTKQHKKDRLKWIQDWAALLSDPSTPVCYLDEKWFYTTARRRKIKLLPPGPGEDESRMRSIIRPKIRSR